jgi:SSS family transporter
LPARSLDLGLIAVYLITVTVFGARFRHKQKSLKDYFLGGREAPWWAISLSIVAAETSTLTIVGTPALAFDGNLGFLQLVLGYLVARVVISVLFIPQYFRGQMFTAYELMQRRFGERVRRFAACTFLLTRSLAEGVRVFAISLVVSVILGTGEVESIVIISLLTLFYTLEGGMTAVIWTDVVQMALYVSGAVLSFVLILGHISGGWSEVVVVAARESKFQIFDFGFEPGMAFFSRTYTFWAGLLGGCFLVTATHGTDQLMVQRLLSARNQRDSRLALFSSWIVILLQFSLFLMIGLMLYVFYQQAGLPAPEPRDRLYPAFVWDYLPPVAAGLVVAAILAAAMSNLSAALNSLASSTVMDLYLPLFGRGKLSDARALKLSRLATFAWGIVLVSFALLARQWGPVLEAGLAIASVPLGALLGVFCLGVLTERVKENAAIGAMISGFLVIGYVTFYTTIAWTWYVVIGATTTFASGCLLSLVHTAPAEANR